MERQKLWSRLKREDFRGLMPPFYKYIYPWGTFSLDLNRPSLLELV